MSKANKGLENKSVWQSFLPFAYVREVEAKPLKTTDPFLMQLKAEGEKEEDEQCSPRPQCPVGFLIFFLNVRVNQDPNRWKCSQDQTRLWDQVSAVGSSPISRYFQKKNVSHLILISGFCGPQTQNLNR